MPKKKVRKKNAIDVINKLKSNLVSMNKLLLYLTEVMIRNIIINETLIFF